MDEDNLWIRKRKIMKQIRDKEVNSYMDHIRQQLLIQCQENQNAMFSENDFIRMRTQLKNQMYSNQSIHSVVQNLMSHDLIGMINPLGMLLVRRILENYLKNNMNIAQDDYILRSCRRIVDFIIKQSLISQQAKKSLPIEAVYDQILSLLSNSSFQMQDLWSDLARLRFQVYYNASLKDFLNFCKKGASQSKDLVSLFLLTVYNFIYKLQETTLKISINDLFNIANQIGTILQNYDLNGKDIVNCAEILQYLMRQKGYETIFIDLFINKSIILNITRYLTVEYKQQITESQKVSILHFIAIIFSSDTHDCYQVLKQLPLLVKLLCEYLPKNGPFTSIQNVRSQKMLVWQNFNENVVVGVIYCLCNIVCCGRAILIHFSNNDIRTLIQMSQINSSKIKSELSIFFHNLLLLSNQDYLQILCQMHLLDCLDRLIREQYQLQIKQVTLKTLIQLHKLSTNFPQSNIAWYYNQKRIESECDRLGLIRYIEGLLVNKNNQISTLAETFLNGLQKL